MEQHSYKQKMKGQMDDVASGSHDAEDARLPETRPSLETAPMAIDQSSGCTCKNEEDLKMPFAQDKPETRDQVGVVGPYPPLAESTHGACSSSATPAAYQSSYVSFGPMVQEPCGDRIRNETSQETERSLGAECVHSPSTMSKGKEIEHTTAVHKPTQVSPTPQPSQIMSDLPWEKDTGAPLPKLPIRFVDCIDRYYIFPWQKVRTWKGMKKLILSAFANINNLRPHIMAGHYDLVIHDVWVDPIAETIKSTLARHPSQFNPVETALSSFTFAGPSLNSITPTRPPSHLLPKPCKGSTILPELWDDIVEPGMMIKMIAWPGVGRDTRAPSTQHSQAALGFTWPRRSDRPPPTVMPSQAPRGKTRKRQDGL